MRLHLAGTSPLTNFMRLHTVANSDHQYGALAAVQHPWRLISYLDLKQSLHEFTLYTDPASMIVDSGLFSLMFGAKQGSMPATFEAYRDYTRKYLDDLDSIGYRGMLVESDVHRLLGMDAVHRLREEFAPLKDRVVYVWHTPEGIEGLKKLAQERSYIALSIPELRIVTSGGSGAYNRGTAAYRSAVWKLLETIHASVDAPPRIHLLGCTVPELMQTRLAWSCDSTSWLSGVRYGSGWVYGGGGRLSTAPMKSCEFAAWRAIALATVQPDLMAAIRGANKDYIENEVACAYAFAQYQLWLDAHYEAKPVKEYTL